MKLWQIKYHRIPFMHNQPGNATVEAETAADALTLLKESLGEGNGVHNYRLGDPVEYVRPAGRVVSQ